MALIDCPECSTKISDKAKQCVNCGFNLQLIVPQATPVGVSNKSNFQKFKWPAIIFSVILLLIFIFSSDPSKNDPEYIKNIVGEWKSNEMFNINEEDFSATFIDLTSYQSNKSYESRGEFRFSSPDIKVNISFIESGIWKIINGELIITPQSISTNPIDSNSQAIIEEYEDTELGDILTGKVLEIDTIKIKELTKNTFVYSIKMDGETLIVNGKKTIEHPMDKYEGELYLHSKKRGYFKYTGEITNNTANGVGAGIHSDGEEYVGDYKDGKRHGKGTGGVGLDKYVGDFRFDVGHGRGIMYYADGKKIEGVLENGEFVSGKINYIGNSIGSTYEGDLVNFKRDGFGIYTWESGDYFVGNWKNGLQHGKGKQFNKYKQLTKEGIWINGKFSELNF
ncbi:MAG: hypothetical protein V7719_15250 [Psychroserpens sp.]|uniref:hypothetical protein n=1 Tax=Psychroserpens sp. TaxID=2020870 RepID=UPI003002F05E